MKKIVQFLCLMLLMVIGSVGQVWAHRFDGKGLTHPTNNGSKMACYIYNIGLDAFLCDNNGTLTLTSADSNYEGATKMYVGEATTAGYTYISDEFGRYFKVNQTSVSSAASKGTNYSQYSGDASGYRLFYKANSYSYSYYLYANNSRVISVARNNLVNQYWMLISEEDYWATQYKYYFEANASVNIAEAGTAVVSFVENDGAATASAVTEAGGNGGADATAHFTATRNPGYKFLGWFDAAVGGNQLAGSLSYEEDMHSTSDDEANPYSITRYARFEAQANYDAEVKDADGNIISNTSTTWADAVELANDNPGSTIKLMRDVENASSATLTASTTIMLNGSMLKGSATPLTINGADIEVVLKNNSSEGYIGTTGTAAAVVVTNGTFSMQGGKVLAQNASAIGVQVNGGSLIVNDGASVVAEGTNAIAISVDNAAQLTINGGVVSGEKEGVVLQKATCKATINNGSIHGGTNALNVKVAATTGAVVKGGLFEGAIATATNGILKGGYYKAAPTAAHIATNYISYTTLEGTAIYDAGYTYGVGGSENGAVICRVINGSSNFFFSSLEAALDYANQNSNATVTIIMMADYTLPAGYYTLPAKATLLVPYKDGTGKGADQAIGSTSSGKNDKYDKPTAFRTLTIATSAFLDVFGKLEVSGQLYANGQGAGGNGIPTGPDGRIKMNANSKITLQSGSNLYAWGYIIGAGEIDARRGSTVYEAFQIYDWKGGSASSDLNNNPEKIFVVNQYYIQNIEVPIRFRPGSMEKTSFGVTVNDMMVMIDDIAIIGLRNKKSGAADDVALFLLDEQDDSEDTWVMKDYDEINDRQVYSINSAAALSAVNITKTLVNLLIYKIELKFNSKNYVLPITNNMTIHLLSGTMDITQDVALLPGAEIINDKESTITISQSKTLYLYDYEDWGLYAYHSSGNSAVACPVKYSPTWGTSCPRATGSAASLGDAKLNIHGTLDVKGYLRTTEGGANIFSNVADAGTIIYSAEAKIDPDPSRTTDTEIWQVKGTATKESKHTIPALLQNEDAAATETVGTLAGKSFCYLDIDGDGKGQWTSLRTDGCFVIDDTNPSNEIIYIKPGAYVAVTSKEADDNHLYRSVTGKRLFIVLHSSDHKSCQWWEVTKTEEDDAVYYCEDNDTYYYYDNIAGKWMVKKIAVRWQNYDGELIGDPYEVPFGGHPQYLGTNPKRPATTYYTYSFAGWYPEITDDVRLYEDMTYVAQYEEHEIRYTVTFVDENGKTIESQFVKVGEIPVCNFQPTKQGYYLFWRNKTTGMPIAAVSGNVTYEAYYEDIPPTTFTVVFQNYNGAILKLADGSTDAVYEVEEGVKPAYTGVIPTKDPTADKEFVFAGWTPDIVPTTKDMTYVAKFDATPRKYTITFLAEDGETVLDKQSLGYGEVPVCRNTPTKNPDVANYYVALWADNEGNNVPLSAVTKATTYTHAGFAAFKNTLRVTVSAGAHGSVTMDGSSSELSKIYEYGDEVTIAATATDAHYHFAQWSDGSTANPRVLLATQTTNLVAEFAIDQVVVTFADEEGKTIATTNVDYNTVPAYVGATPIKANTCGMYYTFTGWSPAFTAATVAQTYTAQFKGTKNPALISYQVAFDGNGATSGSMPNQGFDKGSEQKLTKNAFAKVLYTTTFDFNGNGQANQVVTSEAAFAGWNVDATHYADEAVVSNLTEECDGVVTMVAQWDNTVPAITLPVPAEWAGHTFDGWYDGETKVTTYTPLATKTLTAHWTAKKCKITWMNDTGNEYRTDEVNYGEMPSYGSIPTKAGGYTFVAWTPTIVKAVIDAEYVANFRDNSKATVIFNLMGKGDDFDDQEKIEAKITEPEDIYTTGYHIAGWYKESTLENEWNFASDLMPEDGVTLYAKWEANQWTISFDADYTDAPAIAGISVSYDAAIAGMPTPEREGYDFEGWFTEKKGNGTKYENDYNYNVDDNITLYAKWEIKRFYITFTNMGGLLNEVTNEFKWGEMASYAGEPVKANTEDYIYTFIGWEPALAIVTKNATYTAVFSETARAGRDLVESSSWNVTEADKASSLTITETGNVSVNVSLTLDDLIIKSDGERSGQLNAIESQLHVTNAHFDLTLNAQTRTWYAVAVPWNVDSETGISANGRTLTLGRDFDIIYYDGAARAAAQPNTACWSYVEDDANKTIVPGKFYLMFFARPYETIRFTKKAGADIIYTSNEVAMTAYPVSNGADPDLDYGWNGIANPKLYHAYMNAGVEYGTVLKSGNIDDGSFGWDVCELASTPFVVGSPVFVQAAEGGNALVSKTAPAPVAARVMANNSKTATYEVRIAPADAAAYSDRLYVSADENATGSYTIGKDLLKMGVASRSAQMWINQYNSLLAVNTAVLHNDMANFSLGISAPQEGMYTISLADVPAGRELYLLQNGSVIANLSMGAYTIYLQKGTSSEYSLRIGAINAPGQATDLEEAVVDATTVVEKVVINGKLYIITEGHVYDAVGRMIK